MRDLLRQEIVDTARTVVVKIGTNVLARDDDSLNVERIAHFAEQLHELRLSGRHVVLVSSGAVGAGMGILGLRSRPRDLPHLQAAASVGQAHLIRLYDRYLQQHGYHAGQVLLTANDFKKRDRYLNVRNTLSRLFEYGVIPIVNENDTVSVDEIKFGDNDHLAAMVTNLLHAPLLIILSNVDGLYDGHPDDPQSRLIPLVEQWDDQLLDLADEQRSTRGTGGMQSKLRAVRTATAVGENVLIANGTRPGVLRQILNGEPVGTLFLARGALVPAWKRWIGYTVEPRGRLMIDAGACRAIASEGRSLLAIGITGVQGNFTRGEVVAVVNEHLQEIGRGLTNYDSRAARTIAGKRTDQIQELLGHLPYVEVIHRDNLVITGHEASRNG